MSIKRVDRKRGPGWLVRFRDGGRNCGRVFDRRSDALAFETEVRRLRPLGTLPQLDSGEEPLSDFAREWWRLHAKPNLAASTLKSYASVWDRHVLPYLGGHKLRQITPQVTASLRADLDAAGVGASTIRRALFVLQSVLRLAVIQGRVQTNPVKVVSKPRQRREPVRPLTPETVERLRAELDHRGATLVSVLAYAGLRPSEAIALTWSCVRKRTLLVRGAVVLGEEKPPRPTPHGLFAC